MEYFEEATELCDYIQDMLQEKMGYYSFNSADIKNIVSAKLDICSETTNDMFYSQTITDEETLQLFEEWFCNAEYVSGDCGNNGACLELTTHFIHEWECPVLSNMHRIWLCNKVFY